jgi:hypothetical protein
MKDGKTVVITFTIGKEPGFFLMRNLIDFAWNLDGNLQDEKQGKVRKSGEQGKLYLFEDGIFTVTIEKTSLEIVELYLTAFINAMRKHEHRFIFNINESA